MSRNFSESIQNIYQAPSKCLFKWILGLYEFLERLEGKIRDGIFFCKSNNYSVIKDDNLSLRKKSLCKSNYFSEFEVIFR